MNTKSFAVLFILLFATAFVSAEFSWGFGKAKYCEVGNVTGSDCEDRWCTANDCIYDSTIELCMCGISDDVNSSSFYNKTEIDKLFEEKLNESNRFNLSENSTIATIEYVDDQDFQLRNSVIDRIDNETSLWLSRSSNNSSNDSEIPGYVWVLLFFFGFLALIVLIYMMNKNQSAPQPQKQSNVKNFARTLAPRRPVVKPIVENPFGFNGEVSKEDVPLADKPVVENEPSKEDVEQQPQDNKEEKNPSGM